jgi:metal-responsive CopG/Arc/MetJ family transcriptional regulator
MKVAISIPDSVFAQAERLAQELHVPRSKLYAEAIAEYLERHGGSAVTAKLNAVYSEQSCEVEPAFAQAQSATLSDEAW